jgi:hypothetical protein
MLSEQRLRDAGQRQTTFHAIGHRLGDEGTAYLSPETAAIGMLSLYLLSLYLLSLYLLSLYLLDRM